MLPNVKLSADLIIIALFAFGALLGLFLGLERIKFLAVSAYVGLVLGDTVGGPAYDLIHARGIGLKLGVVRLIIFAIPILILVIGNRPRSKARQKRGLLALMLGLIIAAMMTASALHLMDSALAADIIGSSQIAWWLDHLRLAWLVAIPAVALIELLAGDKASH